ncbi:hypothetical protein SOVF_155980 [Spinacia oleracea]|nr:hypothetical protein SOVF_155980 [Spinacia oleracea]
MYSHSRGNSSSGHFASWKIAWKIKRLFSHVLMSSSCSLLMIVHYTSAVIMMVSGLLRSLGFSCFIQL